MSRGRGLGAGEEPCIDMYGLGLDLSPFLGNQWCFIDSVMYLINAYCNRETKVGIAIRSKGQVHFQMPHHK